MPHPGNTTAKYTAHFFMIGQKTPDESGAQQTRHVETMMFLCWASVADAGPT